MIQTVNFSWGTLVYRNCFGRNNLMARRLSLQAFRGENVSRLACAKVTRQGFEPQLKEPESFVLPLHHRAVYLKFIVARHCFQGQPVLNFGKAAMETRIARLGFPCRADVFREQTPRNSLGTDWESGPSLRMMLQSTLAF